jgi:hypothetical protein
VRGKGNGRRAALLAWRALRHDRTKHGGVSGVQGRATPSPAGADHVRSSMRSWQDALVDGRSMSGG